MDPGALVGEPACGLPQREPPAQTLGHPIRCAARAGIQPGHRLHRGGQGRQQGLLRTLTRSAVSESPRKEILPGFIGLVFPDRPSPVLVLVRRRVLHRPHQEVIDPMRPEPAGESNQWKTFGSQDGLAAERAFEGPCGPERQAWATG